MGYQATANGKLDAVVLNAGSVEPIGTIETVDETAWLQAVQLNLAAPFLLAKHLLPALAQNSGRLITIGTGAATSPIPSWSAYCTSKAALLML
ncbi:MAG TPA: SDR family NAD(P)-dependent oxidoreductase, partial [Phycisphaerales bacterium]|nr:SDR family NAD(P)-dependent oxidoreductase [Phycisphaerales bacterium]